MAKFTLFAVEDAASASCHGQDDGTGNVSMGAYTLHDAVENLHGNISIPAHRRLGMGTGTFSAMWTE
jgi:hypothetical protein